MPVYSSRRKFLKTVAGISATLALTRRHLLASGPDSRPNIVFFLVDDQRNDTLGCAGHPVVKTPRIDSLAASGCRFSNAFVTTSICAASRASIITGLYERTHGYTFGTPPVKDSHADYSYPVLLRDNGYRTGYIGKFGIETSPRSLERMFDYFKPLGRNPYFHTMADGTKRHETDLAADHAVNFLSEGNTNNPFMLCVSFNAAHAEDSDKENHYPWPPSSDGLYEDVDIPPPELSDPEIFNSQPDFLKNSINRERYYWRWDTPAKYQDNMRGYFRMLTGIDTAIGRVVDELQQRGLDKNTVIVYMADNGYYMGNRGFAGKWSHYEESLRIPLIIYDPRVEKNNKAIVNKAMALNIDIAPTLMDIAGINTPTQYQGISLLPHVNGQSPGYDRKDFFCEHLMDYAGIPKWEGVRGERFVYARYFEQQPVFEFLHDLEKDPKQLVNYARDPAYKYELIRSRLRCKELRKQYST